MTPQELVALILNLSKSNRRGVFDDKTIAVDIFIVLISGAFIPQRYVWQINATFDWYQKCQMVLNELIEECIRNMMSENVVHFIENKRLFLQETTFLSKYFTGKF